MRSQAIDDLISQYLALPARVSWDGALGDSMRGIFEGGRLELAGIALLALPCRRLVLACERFEFSPGLPARIRATAPRVELVLDQAFVERWLARMRAPFSLALKAEGIAFSFDVAGLPVSRALATLEIDRGWFVLRSKRGELLGFENRLAALFRAFFPMPKLAPETRLDAIRHREGELVLELALADFEEEVRPGLVERMQQRFLPMPGRFFAANSPFSARA